MILLKILLLLLVLLLLALPFLPLRWIFSFSYYAIPNKTRRRTLLNIAVLAALALLCIVLMPLLRNLAVWFGNLKPIHWLLSKIPAYAAYSTDLAVTIFVNVLYCLAAFAVLLSVQGGARLIERLRAQGKSLRKGKDRLKKKLSADPQEAKQKKQPPTKEPMPPELLPEPEEAPVGNRILIPGKLEEKKPPRGRQRKAAQAATQEKRSFSKLSDRIRSIFYENVEDIWYIRPQLRHVAKHMRNFLCLVGAMYLLVFLLLLIPALFRVTVLEDFLYRPMQYFLSISYLYPAPALALLTMLFRLINTEPSPLAPTEAAQDAELLRRGRVVDLDAVEENLIKACGKDYEVFSFYSSDVLRSGADRTVVDLSENDLLRSVADYVQKEGLELNQDYLLGIKGFVEGRNVIFQAPLYTAVGTYLYAALNLRILQGERIVVVCHNRSQISNYIEQMQQGFTRLTRTHKPLWRIVTREAVGRDADEDILVLTPEDFRDERLFAVAEKFFSQVTVALLPDANLLVSANNYYCQVIAQRLQQHCKKGLQYLFLSTRTTLNLDNALTDFFLLDRKPDYSRGDYGYGDVHIYVWRSKQDSAVLLDNAAQTMPLEVCISDIANRFGITEPNLISDSAIYSNQINSHWLDIYDSAKRPLGFAIVADDSFNLPSVIYAYSRYIGKKASVLHIISRQYLLRNYFYAHATRYLFEQPLMERSMVEHAKQDKADMIHLLCRLMEGIPVDDFVLEMQRFGCMTEDNRGNMCVADDFNAISELADKCLELALGCAPDRSQEHFTLYRPKEDFYPRQHIRISEDYDVLSRLLEETSLVQLRFRSGARKPVYINLFRRMLDQRYLLGQNLVYAHQNYEIKAIDRVNGVIDIDDASSVHGLARDYVQLRRYQLNSESFPANCRESGAERKPSDDALQIMREEFAGEENLTRALCMVRSETSCKVSTDTLGYYIIHTDGRSLRVTNSSIPIIRLDERAREALHREVTGCVYLRLELRRSRDDRLTMTFAALLQEMLKTLFPDCYFCLSVCPILANPDAIYNASDFKSRTIAQLYPRLENWGAVCDDSIELLLVDDCEGGTGAIDLLFAPEGTFLQNVFWMLGDYLEWQRENESSPYIFFGMDTQPTIFDLDGIRPILQVFTKAHQREPELHSQLEIANRCTLCGEPVDEPYLWHDKHMICQCCSEEYTPNEEEANRVLRYAADYLAEQFSVTLPQLTVQVLPELHEDALSELDLEQKTIHLIEDLPLTAMHVQLLLQLVRYWQLEHLDITGAPEVEGQCNYVLLQYLRYLKQYQYAQHLHRSYLLGKDEASIGYCALLQLLQAEGHDNSFLYLLKHHRGGGKTPFKPVIKKNPSRKLRSEAIPYYHRSRLSGKEAAAYDAILEVYLRQAENADLSAYGLSTEQVERLHRYVFRDHPEIFWSNARFSWNIENNMVTVLTPNYTMSQEERESRQKQIDEALDPFIAEISDEMGDYEVALKLYETVIGLLDYDTIALQKQKRTPNFDSYPDDLRSLYGAVVQHRAVCAGYAKVYQYLLLRCGIEALYVCGDCVNGGYHAWNIVKLEGDYYHVDVTWGDSSNTDPNKNRQGMSYAYFAVTDEQIRRSRNIEVEPPQPRCTSDNCNYFVRQQQFFTSYHVAEIQKLLVERFKDPSTSFVELCFANSKLLRNAEYYLCKNGGVYEALRAAGREDSKVSTLLWEDICLLKLLVE